MKRKYPHVTIVILNWNGLQDTRECLRSLEKLNYPQYDIIVVDNDSGQDEAGGLERIFGDKIKIIRNIRNLGYAGGNNTALKYILRKQLARYTLLLNNDTTVEPNLLLELVQKAEEDNSIGSIGPDIRLYDRRDKSQIKRYGLLKELTEVDTLSGACLLLRNSALEICGLFDTIFFLYCEDEDLHARLRKGGFKVKYLPSRAKVYHKVENSSRKVSGLQAYHMTRNRFLLVRRYMMNLKGLRKMSFDNCQSLVREMVVYKNWRSLPSFISGFKDGLLLFIQNPAPKF
ncbi:glycosyltransferase family 2 protein [Patescibacteria group bacterium]|nr:glycosyltransferase family 2 protein [Patescibacteria group bacterium]